MIEQPSVLVVDDEPGIRDLLRIELEGLGYRVQTAANGEIALERARAQKFDVVVSDVMMPKVDGLDLLSALKKAIPDTELIVMTGYGTVDTAVKAMKKGACDFIQKPFNLPDMMTLIQKALERRRRREDESIQRDKLAHLGQMTASVVHDLKNPLGGIALLAQMMLEDGHLGEEQKQDLRMIMQQSRDCATIVQSVLQLSRKESGALESVSLRNLIDRILRIVRHDFESAGIDVDWELPKEDFSVRGYSVPLQQVVFNLITNARQAMKDSAVKQLSLQLDASEQRVLLKVADTGCGIAPDNLEKIFDPFFTTKSAEEGTGLGLYICRDIVARHEGRIVVESIVGKGSTFTIDLPLASSL